jgi:uncharacterized repeat protein (TIGR03847 family)
MSDELDLGAVDRFTAGAVGRPGQRVFYLQARHGGQDVTVKCEKQHVAALGEYLRGLLSDLPSPDDVPHSATLELNEPAEPRFVVGSLGVAYDPADDRIVVLVEEVVPVDEEGEPDPVADEQKAALRFGITRGQAMAFADRAELLVAAGRPNCRFCGKPMDLEGHACPRMN